MEFKTKFRFHGPALLALHQWTAFLESDSMMIGRDLVSSHEREIFSARRHDGWREPQLSLSPLSGWGLRKHIGTLPCHPEGRPQ